MIDYDRPIPKLEFPNHNVVYEIIDEAMVDLKSLNTDRIIFEPRYKMLGIRAAIDKCLMREQVAVRLLDAVTMLPQNYGFKIFDAYRPFKVQQELFDKYREYVTELNRDKNPDEIDSMVNKFVSVPHKDPERPPVHTTGGAIDLTVINLNDKRELDMGTDFDCFGEEANTAYFEYSQSKSENKEIIYNRRMLYNVMTQAGFTNLPSEWWHYDYGNSYWAYNTGNNAKYGGIFDYTEEI